MFTRDGAFAFKKDLTNTIAFCEVLNQPQNKFKSIHIAGTNGKGSTSHALAAIFQTSGYKTGLYTSPHLVDFRERIRINGEQIPETDVIQFVEEYKEHIERIKPSFFEVTVAMAFHYFALQKVDIAIIETGLGGRLDSTNIITPELSVITNISFDHQNMLGHTLAEIAQEKAGIIKPHVPVVISEFQEEIASVFIKKADSVDSPLYFASQWFTAKQVGREIAQQQVMVETLPTAVLFASAYPGVYNLDVLGSYQLKNVIGIMGAVTILNQLGWNLSKEHVQEGLAQLTRITGLRGRWECLNQTPLVMCDTGHNEDGWIEVLQNIALTPHEKLHIVIGVMADKDIQKMLPLLPKEANYYFCQVDLPRAMKASILAEKALDLGYKGSVFDNVKNATCTALQNADTKDLIFVGGSTFIVGDLIAHEKEVFLR